MWDPSVPRQWRTQPEGGKLQSPEGEEGVQLCSCQQAPWHELQPERNREKSKKPEAPAQ